jgi:MCP family monocarboxylic acid transporter-like MFS transporter 13
MLCWPPGVLLLGWRRAAAAPRAVGQRCRVAGGTVPGLLRQAMATPHFRWLYADDVLAGPVMFIPFAHVSAAARDLGVDDARRSAWSG